VPASLLQKFIVHKSAAADSHRLQYSVFRASPETQISSLCDLKVMNNKFFSNRRRIDMNTIKFDDKGNLVLPEALQSFSRWSPSNGEKLADMFGEARVPRMTTNEQDALDMSGRDAPDEVWFHEEHINEGVAKPRREERKISKLEQALDDWETFGDHNQMQPKLKMSVEQLMRLCELRTIAQSAEAAAEKIEGGWLI